jgi:hypothetical protein
VGMDELNTNKDLRENIDEEEISVTDKMIGVLSEPTNLFQKLSIQKPKTTDWIIPILLLVVVASLSRFIMMNNPEIKADAMEKQMEVIEKSLQDAVDKGNMTQDQADEQIEKIRERMEEGGSGQLVMTIVGILIFAFITFFIIAGIFYLLAKITLGGEGNFSTSMVAYGLPHYIIVIQILVTIILAMTMNKMFIDTSVGSFLDLKNDTLIGLLAHKLDVFSIWFYAVISIAYAKMFKSENIGKYFIAIFGLWVGFSVLMFFLGKAVPFLKMFGM